MIVCCFMKFVQELIKEDCVVQERNAVFPKPSFNNLRRMNTLQKKKNTCTLLNSETTWPQRLPRLFPTFPFPFPFSDSVVSAKSMHFPVMSIGCKEVVMI